MDLIRIYTVIIIIIVPQVLINSSGLDGRWFTSQALIMKYWVTEEPNKRRDETRRSMRPGLQSCSCMMSHGRRNQTNSELRRGQEDAPWPSLLTHVNMSCMVTRVPIEWMDVCDDASARWMASRSVPTPDGSDRIGAVFCPAPSGRVGV